MVIGPRKDTRPTPRLAEVRARRVAQTPYTVLLRGRKGGAPESSDGGARGGAHERRGLGAWARHEPVAQAKEDRNGGADRNDHARPVDRRRSQAPTALHVQAAGNVPPDVTPAAHPSCSLPCSLAKPMPRHQHRSSFVQKRLGSRPPPPSRLSPARREVSTAAPAAQRCRRRPRGLRRGRSLS